MFYIEEQNDDVSTVVSNLAIFKVNHRTNVESEEYHDDYWCYLTDSHYTKGTGRFNHDATTEIISIELMLENDVFVPVTLDAETTAKIKAAIEREAERQAAEDKEKEIDFYLDDAA